MHSLSSAFVLGYHGCDRAAGERILRGEAFLKSDNAYDWLGPGVYFWENDPERGLAFAKELKAHPSRGMQINSPYVIGAVIAPGICLDMTTHSSQRIIQNAFRDYSAFVAKAGDPLPKNSADLLRRYLDCAVIRYLHRSREEAGLPLADTVRGVFIEGEALYEGSGFHDKTHIQIAVRTLDCIKGVFRVPEHHLGRRP